MTKLEEIVLRIANETGAKKPSEIIHLVWAAYGVNVSKKQLFKVWKTVKGN